VTTAVGNNGGQSTHGRRVPVIPPSDGSFVNQSILVSIDLPPSQHFGRLRKLLITNYLCARKLLMLLIFRSSERVPSTVRKNQGT
jgi:hypothetical protein